MSKPCLKCCKRRGVGGFFSVLWVTARMVLITFLGDDFAGAQPVLIFVVTGVGEGVLGMEGGSSREVFELCVGRAATEGMVVGSGSVAVRCVRSGGEGGEGEKGTVFMWDSTRIKADGATMPAPMSTSFRLLTMAFAMAQYHGASEKSLRVLAISFIHGSFGNCVQV